MLYFSIQNASPRWDEYKVSEAAGARWRFHGRIIVGLSSECRRIVFLVAEAIHGVSAEMSNRFRARRSIWWGWKLTVLAPRIVNDVSYVTRINHEIHFAWQALYLVRFEVDFACSAHSKWRFISDADQSWDSFCGWIVTFRGRRSIWWHFGR